MKQLSKEIFSMQYLVHWKRKYRSIFRHCFFIQSACFLRIKLEVNRVLEMFFRYCKKIVETTRESCFEQLKFYEYQVREFCKYRKVRSISQYLLSAFIFLSQLYVCKVFTSCAICCICVARKWAYLIQTNLVLN